MPNLTLAALHLYPVKSCGGIALAQADLLPTGLAHDRSFMVVHQDSGHFISQRTHPMLALVKCAFKLGQVVLRAPGMVRMDLPLDVAGDDVQVTVWNDTLMACDMGEVAAAWFTQVLSTPARLVRFNPEVMRAVSTQYTQGITAPTEFSDGYPVLVMSTASLTHINERLLEQGMQPVAMNRFRPNLVIEGVEAFEEDYLDTLSFGDAMLKLVKPCIRCEIPNTDQDTAERYAEPGRTLAQFRMRADMHGAVCVGMNAIVLKHGALWVGQAGVGELRF
jgi:uncharacterized protein